MIAFAGRLGNPERRFRSVHIAGTNGKGSVSSMLAAALSAKGLKVGLYTSPHLVDFRERMKIVEAGKAEMVSEEYVCNFLGSVQTDGLSFFEITTGMAFRWFADCEVDIAVIETGLGGRLDSTNIIVPQISIITGIGLDHCALLGSTKALIAREKAGIFKPGVPALVASRDIETVTVFENAAAEVHCPLFFAEDLVPGTQEDLVPGTQIDKKSDDVEAGVLKGFDLSGPCQAMNLRTVLAALQLEGVEPDFEALSHTAAITSFHGRWERLSISPEVICDIGHNPQALEINFRQLEKLGRPLLIVYGIMADKDLDAIAPLMPDKASFFLAAPSTERSLRVEELETRLSRLRPDLSLRSFPSVKDAVEAALKAALEADMKADMKAPLINKENSPLVYIGGSTFVVAEAIPLFRKPLL